MRPATEPGESNRHLLRKGSDSMRNVSRRQMLGIMGTGLAAIGLVGCSQGSSNGDGSASTGSADKNLKVGLYWFGTNLDPFTEYNAWTTCRAGISETLVTLDTDLNIQPLVADSWEMSDETTWKFHIRQGVKFHNGEACDANAVKKSFDKCLTVTRAQTSSYISSIDVDGENVVFHTSEPNASFLNAISEPLFSIQYVDDSVDYENAPVCTGPFKVKSFQTDVEIQTERFDDYWGGASPVATMTIKNVEDDSARAMALQSGELDLVQRIAASDLPQFSDNSGYEVIYTQGVRTRVVQFNYKNQYLSDINVRKAFVNAIDYDALLKIAGSDMTASGAPYPLDKYGYKDIPVAHYDQDAAKSALEASGYKDSDGDGYVDKDGKALELTLTYDVSGVTNLCEAMQDMLKQVGIKLNLNLVESLDDITINHAFDLTLTDIQYLSTGDPTWMLQAIYRTGSGTNYGQYSNPELDSLIDELAKTFDEDKKDELVKEAQTIMLNDACDDFLLSKNNLVVAKSSVKDALAHPVDYYLIDNKVDIQA